VHLCIVPHNVVHIAPSCSCLIVFGPILTSASAWAWRGCSRWCASGWGAPRSPLLRNGIRGSTAPRGSACAATRALSGTNTTSCLSVRPLGPPVRLSRTSGAPLGTSPPAPGPTFHAAFRFTALHLSNRSGFQAPTIQEHVAIMFGQTWPRHSHQFQRCWGFFVAMATGFRGWKASRMQQNY